MSTETLVKEVRTDAPCPNCKEEINLVLCEPIVCPKCEMLVAVHKHKGGDEHLVHGMKAKKKVKPEPKAKPKKAPKIEVSEEEIEEIGKEEE
jgi:hypothetical protein